jgi:hypothetical protein
MREQEHDGDMQGVVVRFVLSPGGQRISDGVDPFEEVLQEEHYASQDMKGEEVR